MRMRKTGQLSYRNSPRAPIRDKVFLGTCFRASTTERLGIFSVTIPETFREIQNTGLTVRVGDASDMVWARQTKRVLDRIPGIDLQYQLSATSFPERWLDMLRQAREPYFCALFDDQPICGLTSSFLESAYQLLHDYRDLIDVMLIEQVADQDCHINPITESIYVDLAGLEWKRRKRAPLAIVTYGKNTFGIFENFHYGFFLNTMVASRAAYLRRLEWYTHNISHESIHAIEIAGKQRIGPVFRYIAIAQGVFRLDLDFQHTDISLRGATGHPTGNAEKLYQALKEGYNIKYVGERRK